jgi:peptide subunit release factor 1 (eRF1)
MKLTDKLKEIKPDEMVPECNLYVMTNSTNSNGSIYMTDRDVLDDFAEKMSSNFYIIPSSVHEVILYPDDEMLSKEQLQEMVSEVNRYVLSDVEYLSDSVYYYDRDKKVITY